NAITARNNGNLITTRAARPPPPISRRTVSPPTFLRSLVVGTSAVNEVCTSASLTLIGRETLHAGCGFTFLYRSETEFALSMRVPRRLYLSTRNAQPWDPRATSSAAEWVVATYTRSLTVTGKVGIPEQSGYLNRRDTGTLAIR